MWLTRIVPSYPLGYNWVCPEDTTLPVSIGLGHSCGRTSATSRKTPVTPILTYGGYAQTPNYSQGASWEDLLEFYLGPENCTYTFPRHADKTEHTTTSSHTLQNLFM